MCKTLLKNVIIILQFFSEEKIPNLDIQTESKDILYNLLAMAIHQLSRLYHGDLLITIVIPRHPHHGQ